VLTVEFADPFISAESVELGRDYGGGALIGGPGLSCFADWRVAGQPPSQVAPECPPSTGSDSPIGHATGNQSMWRASGRSISRTS
jgi:hypothetical protein